MMYYYFIILVLNFYHSTASDHSLIVLDSLDRKVSDIASELSLLRKDFNVPLMNQFLDKSIRFLDILHDSHRAAQLPTHNFIQNATTHLSPTNPMDSTSPAVNGRGNPSSSHRHSAADDNTTTASDVGLSRDSYDSTGWLKQPDDLSGGRASVWERRLQAHREFSVTTTPTADDFLLSHLRSISNPYVDLFVQAHCVDNACRDVCVHFADVGNGCAHQFLVKFDASHAPLQRYLNRLYLGGCCGYSFVDDFTMSPCYSYVPTLFGPLVICSGR